MDTQFLIDKITKAISFQYKTDPSAPGLQISSLKSGYYVSIVRYGKPFGKDKIVVCNAKANSINDALKDVADKFLLLKKDSPKDPVQDLSDCLGRV